MSYTARICGLLIILIGGKSVLWAQQKSSDLSIAGLSTLESSPPSVLGAYRPFRHNCRSRKRQKAVSSLWTNW